VLAKECRGGVAGWHPEEFEDLGEAGVGVRDQPLVDHCEGALWIPSAEIHRALDELRPRAACLAEATRPVGYPILLEELVLQLAAEPTVDEVDHRVDDPAAVAE